MRRVLQAARLQLLAQKFAEQQAAGAVGIIVGDEKRIAGIVVVVMLLLALVLPGLQQIVRHRIVVDGDEQIGMHGIGAHRPLEQAAPRRLGGDQQNGLVETGIDERLLDLLGKLKVEGIFRNSARAHGAGHIDGVADVDDDAEFRALAVVAARPRPAPAPRLAMPDAGRRSRRAAQAMASKASVRRAVSRS